VNAQRRSPVDHAFILLEAFLVGLYGLVTLVGLTAPEPPNAIHDGFTGLVIFPALLSLYGGIAVLQNAYSLIPGWRPSWSQAFLFTWIAGLTGPLVIAIVREGLTNGPAAARDMLGLAMIVWGLLIGLPWIVLVTLRARRARANDERAYLDP
jgi:hypothetical protein